MGGDLRQVGGDFLAKALDPEGPPPAQKTLPSRGWGGPKMVIFGHLGPFSAFFGQKSRIFLFF